jgi:hypothetical protein
MCASRAIWLEMGLWAWHGSRPQCHILEWAIAFQMALGWASLHVFLQ